MSGTIYNGDAVTFRHESSTGRAGFVVTPGKIRLAYFLSDPRAKPPALGAVVEVEFESGPSRKYTVLEVEATKGSKMVRLGLGKIPLPVSED